MANLIDIIAFILGEYPVKSDLSNARVTKMVYLADWHQSINNNSQISSIHWYFDSYGPFVRDVLDAAKGKPDLFDLKDTVNLFGRKKTLLSLVSNGYLPNISEAEKASLRHVINTTSALNWNDFIKLVYSTYPIMSSNRYSYLDLRAKAAEYALT